MSSSINIPPRSGAYNNTRGSSSSSSSSYSTSPRTPSQQKESVPGSPSSSPNTSGHYRRPSLLSSSFSKSEHTVINIGDPDGVPRLITCVRSSQGFDWNPEIFLPSYVESDFESLDRKSNPVHEIILTEEEIEKMFPQ